MGKYYVKEPQIFQLHYLMMHVEQQQNCNRPTQTMWQDSSKKFQFLFNEIVMLMFRSCSNAPTTKWPTELGATNFLEVFRTELCLETFITTINNNGL
jgi:hypothetical protein